MRNEDYDEFAVLLDEAYDLIGSGQNKVISGGAKSLFFKALANYPLAAVRKALVAHCMDKEHGRFTPKPADIIGQIEGSSSSDGRPGAEEAWAIAITSRDESETVVWTQEAAEAFAICRPVMDMGDDVGARMAFKEAYNRLVSNARAAGVRAHWQASIGWDADKRTAVLLKAESAGLLAAPQVAALLPAPADSVPHDDQARGQIAKIKEMMAQMHFERDHETALHAERERNATAAAKAKMNELTANYKKQDAA